MVPHLTVWGGFVNDKSGLEEQMSNVEGRMGNI